MPTSGLPFGRFPLNLDGSAEQPVVLLGLSASWKSQKAQGQGCLRLPVASGGSSMAGQGSSSCLELFENCCLLAQFGKLPLGGTTQART